MTYLDFLAVARKAIRRSEAAKTLHGEARREFVEVEAVSLAYSLAELANTRIDDLTF